MKNRQKQNLEVRAKRQQKSGINERNFKKKHKKLHQEGKCCCSCEHDEYNGFSTMGYGDMLNKFCPYLILVFLEPLSKKTIERIF